MRALFCAFLLLEITRACGEPLRVQTKILPGSGPSTLKVFEISDGAAQFLLAPPYGWRAETESGAGTITFYGPGGSGVLVVRFFQNDANAIGGSIEELRHRLVPHLAHATLVEEFRAYSGDREGPGIDLSFVLQGHVMRCRAALIPTASGGAGFVLTCSQEELRSAQHVMGRTLTSFQHLTDQMRQQLAKENVPPPPATLAGTEIKQPIEVVPETPVRRTPAGFETTPPAQSGSGEKENYLRFALYAVLGTIVVRQTVKRYREDGEIETFSDDNYLSRIATARLDKAPLRQSLPPEPARFNSAVIPPVGSEEHDNANATLNPLAGFFAETTKDLVEVRKILSELDRTEDESQRRTPLLKLQELICVLKRKADCPNLRPLWQVTTAMELLLKYLADKPHFATHSTLRTLANAVDLLKDLCVPQLSVNLITDPPIRLLVVDDDPLCRRAMILALQDAFQTPDEAANGERALPQATEKRYDVIFLDIEMPGMDGFTLCSRIRNTVPNRNTPVVFVTSHPDLEARKKSTARDWDDFVAKPFINFEITLKALTFALRSRLDNPIVNFEQATLAVAGELVPTALSSPAPVLAPTENARPAAGESTGITDELSEDFLTKAPEYFAITRLFVEKVGLASDSAERQAHLNNILLRTVTITSHARLNSCKLATRLGSSVEALIKRMLQNTANVTPSTVNTIHNALTLLENLCRRGAEEKINDHSSIRLLVVDDEPLARRAVLGALQLAFEKPDSAEEGAAALALAAQKPYDVIFTDVEMPALNGFEFCKFIRTSGPNRGTPVVFVTCHTDDASRAEATDSGGTDFIAKPFLPIEITVKALTLGWQGRLRRSQSALAPNPSSPELLLV